MTAEPYGVQARSESHFPWKSIVLLAIVIGVLMMLFRRRNPPMSYPVGGPGAVRQPVSPAHRERKYHESLGWRDRRGCGRRQRSTKPGARATSSALRGVSGQARSRPDPKPSGTPARELGPNFSVRGSFMGRRRPGIEVSAKDFGRGGRRPACA